MGEQSGLPPHRQRAAGTRAADRPGEVTELSLDGLDQLWSRAEQQVPGWQTITLRLPGSDHAPVTFTIDRGDGRPAAKAGHCSRWTEEPARWCAGKPSKATTWAAGSAPGCDSCIPANTMADPARPSPGIASAAGVMLVWTGLSLAWRRFWGWRARRPATTPPYGPHREYARDAVPVR